MQDLVKQQRFEMEVLDRLNSGRLLNNLVFCGGTMLRLCYGLERYSVDLDFWVIKELDFKKLYKKLRLQLNAYYDIIDSANKHYTILLELKSPQYPRSLKIEIRKEKKNITVEPGIAFSSNYPTQVMVNIASLNDMMKTKIDFFLNRGEIRDVYDIEFLFKRGIKLPHDKSNLELLYKEIEKLSQKDYSVKLGSLLESGQRKYYRQKNFEVLKMHLINII